MISDKGLLEQRTAEELDRQAILCVSIGCRTYETTL